MIANTDVLRSHGNEVARADLIDIAAHALTTIRPERLIAETVECKGDRLRIDGHVYDLATVGDLFLIATGKGSAAVADALLTRLGDRVTDGVVVEKRGQARPLEGVEVLEAGHPIPDSGSLAAGEAVLTLAHAAGPDDLVIACVAGGTSALVQAPIGKIDISDSAAVNHCLLDAGAPIEDVNAVRKHLSDHKGGRLAAAIHPATLATLVIVDEVAGDPWGPTVPDETTYDDAVAALRRHGCWELGPAAVREHLRAGATGELPGTPTAADLDRVDAQTVVLADASDICEAACERAAALGYDPLLLSTMLEGESREVGRCLAGVAKEIADRERPVSPPAAIVSGGETTVTVTDVPDAKRGDGGPNQEFVLGLALSIAGHPEIAALSIGTDGTDGPTDLAGGIADAATVQRADEYGVDLHERLQRHDAAGALRTLDDDVVTGATGTNVMDLRLVLVTDAD